MVCQRWLILSLRASNMKDVPGSPSRLSLFFFFFFVLLQFDLYSDIADFWDLPGSSRKSVLLEQFPQSAGFSTQTPRGAALQQKGIVCLQPPAKLVDFLLEHETGVLWTHLISLRSKPIQNPIKKNNSSCFLQPPVGSCSWVEASHGRNARGI